MTLAPTGPAPAQLETVLANRRWVRRSRPFPHVVAGNVFVDAFYAELDAEFRRVRNDHPEAFARNMAGYDASGSELRHHADGPLGIFASRPWHDLLARLMGVSATGDVSGSLHHHEPGGAGGWPHNDLNPGWFADPAPGPDAVRLAATSGVNYHTGARPDGVAAHETIRAVSVLFYLANPEWQPGDGGETGLYATQGAAGPAAAVPPVNNSLVLFECTPYSWHGFISNRRTERNCVVMWLHRERDEVVDRWGAPSIVGW
jgi:2-oxoglutarate-Fe(II)-dependent oxygenase superfamily protein